MMRFKQVMAALMEALEGQKLKRAEFIRKQLGNKWKPIPGASTVDEFIELVSEADPSANGMYMPWLARVVAANPRENKVEDLQRTRGDLEMFEKSKNRLVKKDINQYKSFNELFSAIEPLIAVARKEQEHQEKELAKLSKEMVVVYQGPEGWIRVPLTKNASCYLGKGSRWCTASTDSINMFQHYDHMDYLFVIYYKEKKERRQLHLVDGQYMDEQDRAVPLSEIPAWARNAIGNFYLKNINGLSFKQATAAESLTGMKITDHPRFKIIDDFLKKFGE